MAKRHHRIPGTMKAEPPSLVPDESRPQAVAILLDLGSLYARTYRLGRCTVTVSRDRAGRDGSYRWHLSIAHPNRYPTWDEIKTARYSAPELGDVPLMAQLLPVVAGEVEWMNVHENCFHLYEIGPDAIDLGVT